LWGFLAATNRHFKTKGPNRGQPQPKKAFETQRSQRRKGRKGQNVGGEVLQRRGFPGFGRLMMQERQIKVN
jgi:hypothetical protein